MISPTISGTFSIEWSTFNGTIISPNDQLEATVNSPGVYELTVTNLENGCVNSEEIAISQSNDVGVTLPELVALSCASPIRNLIAETIFNPEDYYFTWTYLDETTEGSGENQISVSETGLVQLTANIGECTGNYESLVILGDDYSVDISSIGLPNVFTPNNDESNRLFIPFLSIDPELDVFPFLDNYNMKVFNRWGTPVFESTTQGWDGTKNGNELGEGVYFYVVTFQSACSEQGDFELSGSVSLLK